MNQQFIEVQKEMQSLNSELDSQMKIVHMKDLRCLELEKQIHMQETQILNLNKEKDMEFNEQQNKIQRMVKEIERLNRAKHMGERSDGDFNLQNEFKFNSSPDSSLQQDLIQ